MTMAFLHGELSKSGDPADAQAAMVIAALLESRGSDIPLPEVTIVEPTIEEQSRVPRTFEAREAAALLRLSNVTAPDANFADGVAAHASADRELQATPAPIVTIGEELQFASHKERLVSEQKDHDEVVRVMNSLIPGRELYHVEGNDGKKYFSAIKVDDIERFKRLQSVVYFLHTSNEVGPNVVIGQKVEPDETYAQVLSYDFHTKKIHVCAVRADDLAALNDLPNQPNRSIDEQTIQNHTTSQGKLVLNINTPGTVYNKGKKLLTHHRTTDLAKYGLRFRDDPPYDIHPDISQLFVAGRLEKGVIDEFNMVHHLSRLLNVLGKTDA